METVQGPRRNVWRGWLAVFGGFLVHLSLGTIYTFGNMTPYFTSYIRARGHPSTLRYSSSIWVFALAVASQGFSMFLGGVINSYLGPRWTTLIGGWIMSLGVLLTSLTIKWSFYGTVLSYGVLFGIGVGISYAPPLAAATKWLPNHKGLANGIVVAGFGGGAFIFNQVLTAFINPRNLSPDQPVSPGSTEKYYSEEHAKEVLDRVPYCFLLLGGAYAALQLIGSLHIIDPPHEENARSSCTTRQEEEPLVHAVPSEDINAYQDASTSSHSGDVAPRQAVCSVPFAVLWVTFLFNGMGVLFISTLYKAYGQTFISDDHFLAIVGSIASIANSVGRIFWGYIADRFSYKTAMMSLCTSFMAFLLTFIGAQQAASRAMFFIWVCALFWTFSGNFALFPTAIAKTFGTKYMAVNYGLLFSSQAVAGPVGALLTTSLSDHLGWVGLFFLTASFSFLSMVMTMLFRAKSQNGDNI